MVSHFLLRTSLLILFVSSILASSHLQIPLDTVETDEQLDRDIDSFFGEIDQIKNFLGFNSIITITDTFDPIPLLQQRLMENFSAPIYTVGSQKGPHYHHYPKGGNIVITLLSGLDATTLAALNDTGIPHGEQFFSFLYIPPRSNSRPLTKDEIREFFSWCWERELTGTLLFFRGESEYESWSYFYFRKVTVVRLTKENTYKNVLRRQGLRFLVQAANDPPAIFWYNSSEQADVMGGGNFSLSGPTGLLMVELMRHVNASMDVLPIPEAQSSNYEIFEMPGNRSVDIVANMVDNSSLLSSTVVEDSQMCLLVPHRRTIAFDRYFDTAIAPFPHVFTLTLAVFVFVIKYMAHRRRSLVDSIFSTIRFGFGIPLPGGQLDRLPLADKIIEVYSFLFWCLLIGACGCLLSSALTAGVYYPPIRDVESMRASGLRIITSDPTIKQAFEDNRLPSSLLDLVDVVDYSTVLKNLNDLNDSVVYVVRTPNWRGLQLYQERLQNKRLSIVGPKLCSNIRLLRIPISPKSPLWITFKDYFMRVVDSGIQQKWLRMGFQKYREVFGITKLPVDSEGNWRPLTLDFYSVFIKIYIGGMLLSTLVFLIEILCKRYSG